MKVKFILVAIVAIFSSSLLTFSQQKHKGKFIEYKNEFWDEIHKSTQEYWKKPDKKKPRYIVDFEGLDLPKSKEEFKSFWHNEPRPQGATGTCWSFSTTSFYESEVQRTSGKKVKLSEMYNVYWEYIEKARYFVQTRGESFFGEGSESNAIRRIWKKYGCVPLQVYEGKLEGQKFYDHSKMFEEMSNFLKKIKENNIWNEDFVIQTIKSILNKYMGEPPTKFSFEGKEYTPKSFLTDYLRLNMDDYIDFMSLMEKPYYKIVELEVPDNWWHDSSYYNVPLDDFMQIIKKSIQNGYTMVIGGDVSEPGIESHAEVAIVPTFDIPSEYIDENARQMRFTNNTTGDDHGIHIVGYKFDKNNKMWFLIKDSGSGSFNGNNKGYYFYHEDYVKLKMLSVTVHKDAVKDTLGKFKN
ncbi:MAG: peptidase C1 [Ignavibacteria bacterium]|nr:peptidase C1 [Ignavibacteria bacterium]